MHAGISPVIIPAAVEIPVRRLRVTECTTITRSGPGTANATSSATEKASHNSIPTYIPFPFVNASKVKVRLEFDNVQA